MSRSLLPWAFVAGVMLAVFMAAPVRDLYAQHFRSWAKSTAPATTAWAIFWRSMENPVVLFTFASSIVSGAVGAVRVASGAWGTMVARFATAVALSILIEWTAVGVQDGSARDIDIVQPHSIILLVTAMFAPTAFIALDFSLHRRRQLKDLARSSRLRI